MKQKDMLLIGVIIIVSGIFSYVLANIIIGTPDTKKQQVEVVEPISSNFTAPDKKYFNEQAINPTQTIHIGDTPNQQPFHN